MPSTPEPTDQSLADLFELGETIDALIMASLGGDKERTQKAYEAAIQSANCVALFHGDISNSIIRNNRHIIKASGWRQISVPADWDGPWFVSPEAEPKL